MRNSRLCPCGGGGGGTRKKCYSFSGNNTSPVAAERPRQVCSRYNIAKKLRIRIRMMASIGYISACVYFYILSATYSTITIYLPSHDIRDERGSRYRRSVVVAAATLNGEVDSHLQDFAHVSHSSGHPITEEEEEEEFDYELYHAIHQIPVPALAASLIGLMTTDEVVSKSSSSVGNRKDEADNDPAPLSLANNGQYHRNLEENKKNHPRGVLAFAGTMQAMEEFARENNAVEYSSENIIIKAPSVMINDDGDDVQVNGMATFYESTLEQISKYRTSLLLSSSGHTRPLSEQLNHDQQISDGEVKNIAPDMEEPNSMTMDTRKQWPTLPRTSSDLDNGRYLVGLEVRNVQPHQRIIIDYQDVISSYEMDGVDDQTMMQPLRIQYVLSDTDTVDADESSMTNFRLITTLLDKPFHRSAMFWSQALSLIPVPGSIVPTVKSCGSATIPNAHREMGVENADIVVYVTGDNKYCGGAILHSAICDFDQNMRPLVANINICTKNMPLTNVPSDNYTEGTSDDVLNEYEGYISAETSRILGASTSLLQYYRDVDTGIPYGVTEKVVNCVDGSQEELSLPNIIGEEIDQSGQMYYEIRTPKVIEIVRNHFGCMTITGARLEVKSGVSSCVGSFLDQRHYFGEPLTGFQLKNQGSNISPLTLALLEDSSWYIANYTVASEMSFGRGAGCSFARATCAVKENGYVEMSSPGKGFYCKEIGKMGCSSTHSHKALCDFLHPISNNSMQNQACPMYIRNAVDCTSATAEFLSPGEYYHPSSKCFHTIDGEPICLRASCNEKMRGIDIHYEDEVFTCVRDDQIFETRNGLIIECPTIAAVCPSLFCPSNCAARGVCDEDKSGKWSCICDDPFDLSSGCWGR